jgi:hypothetical protein
MNGQGLQGVRIAEDITGRKQMAEALQSPASSPVTRVSTMGELAHRSPRDQPAADRNRRQCQRPGALARAILPR